MSSRPVVRLSTAVRKYRTDPALVQTTPEDQLVHLKGLEASFTTGPELKSLLKRFETKSNIFMLGEGRAVVSCTTPKAAAEAAALLRKRGLSAFTVPPVSTSGVESGAYTGPPKNTRRRRKQQQEMDDEEFEKQPDLADWHCPQCTLINKGSASTCGVCQYERVMPMPAGGAPPGLEGVDTSGNSTKAQPLLRKAAKISVSNPWALLNDDTSNGLE
uniref:RanBP2-type domain-containing protein n=1 Tax=Lotharella oceanica TaxID=641309 RepID=A0A7S2XFN1_9EUKA